MNGTRTAHGDQRELAGIEPLAYRDEANAFRHLGVDHPMDTGRGALHLQAERLGDAAADCIDGPGGIEPNRAARESPGVQKSQHDRGVGHRRFPATACIAGGAGVGGGGVRPDAKTARVVQPRDAAAARSDRVHVDHRHPHREAVDHSLGTQKRFGTRHERDVRARAAHVERDEVVVPGRGSGCLTADDTRRRAGQEQANRAVSCKLRARQSAPRLHHLERSGHTGVAETRPETGQVATHRRLDVCVEGGDRGALVLAKRGIDIARQRYLKTRMLLARHLSHPALVHRVDEREEQAHRDALGALRDQPIERGPHRALVERLDDLAVRSDALAHDEAHGARGQKHRSLGVEADLVHLTAHLAADLEGIAKPLGRDDAEPASLAFQHRVGRHRGAVRKLDDGAGFDTLPGRQPFDCGDGRVTGVRGGARNLEHDGRPSLAHAHDIRERPPDVDSDPVPISRIRHDALNSFRPSGSPVNVATVPPAVSRPDTTIEQHECRCRAAGLIVSARIGMVPRLETQGAEPKRSLKFPIGNSLLSCHGIPCNIPDREQSCSHEP